MRTQNLYQFRKWTADMRKDAADAARSRRQSHSTPTVNSLGVKSASSRAIPKKPEPKMPFIRSGKRNRTR